ncbi:MAG: hypothetical protein V4717_05635 [Bacteroidota bacterium]
MEKHYPAILQRFLGGERDSSHESDDSTTRKASGICGASQGLSKAAQRKEPIGREEREEYGEQVNLMKRKPSGKWQLLKSFGWIRMFFNANIQEKFAQTQTRQMI